MSWVLEYTDNQLLLRLPREEIVSFTSGAFYKLVLKRYVHQIDEDTLRFKPELTYVDYKKIMSLCSSECCHLTVSESLKRYVQDREMYVEKRSRLGVELKHHESKLADRYEQYKAVVDDAMVRPLREQQMWDSFYLCAMQKACNFSVPGSGKTASALGMYAYLKKKASVKRIIVICPKNAFGSWIDEFTACFGEKDPLRVFNIHDGNYQNTTQRKNALRYDSGSCNLVLINYEAVAGLEDVLWDMVGASSLLVFDEVHKVKRVGGEYASHALELAKRAMYVVAMTGTPIPNTYLDIYNLLHILFPDEYDTFFDFSTMLLNNASPEDVREINDKLQPFFCRTSKDQLGVPRANADALYRFPAAPAENRLMEILRLKYKHNRLALLIRLLQLESNPRLLLQNLNLQDFQYLLDDSVDVEDIDFADYTEEIQELINACQRSTKFDNCLELARTLVSKGKTVIVWCVFVDSIRRLQAALEQAGIRTCCVYGEVPLERREEILNDFRQGNIQVLLTNPHTLAESVSLHKVCHDAIYFEYSYNLVHLLQSKDRIHRLGLPEGQYTQYHFMQLNYQTEEGVWSLDEAVYQRLKEKEQTMLDAIDHHVLESLPTSKEDLDLIFKKLFG